MKWLTRMVPMVLMFSVVAVAKAKEPSYLRVENVCPDCPAVDVLVNGKSEIKGLAFKAVSNYLELPGSKYDIQFVDGRDQKTRLTAGCTVKPRGKECHSLVLFGSFKDKDMNVIDLKDEPTATVKDANLRFVHLSADTPAVEVFEADGNRVFRERSYKVFSEYETLLPGSHTFEIREKGAKSQALKTDVTLEPGKNYTLFLTGQARDNSRQLVCVVEAGKVPSTQSASKPAPETKGDKKAKRPKAGKKGKKAAR